MRLIHYGSKKFNSKLFRGITNKPYSPKPSGGLWASPVDSLFGWKEWSIQESFVVIDSDNSFEFTLTKNARVMMIDSKEDGANLPWFKEEVGFFSIDYESLRKTYDAVHLTLNGERTTKYSISTDKEYDHNRSLYGWDCESVLILNKEVIKCL